MNDADRTITHPTWCDRTLCTAPDVRPTPEQYQVENGGEHRSAPIESTGQDFVTYLSQMVAPWECGPFLRIEAKTANASLGRSSFSVDVRSPLLLLMREQAAEEAKRWPTLVPPLPGEADRA